MTHFSGHVPVRHEWLRSQVNSATNTCQRDALTFLKSPTKCCSRELSFANVFSYQGSSHREGLESFNMPQPLPNQRGPAGSRSTVPRTASNTSQYSESARGSQPPQGGIFLPCCFAFLVGCRRVTWKERSTPRCCSAVIDLISGILTFSQLLMYYWSYETTGKLLKTLPLRNSSVDPSKPTYMR